MAYSFTTYYVFTVHEKQENGFFSFLLFLMYPVMSRSPTIQTCQPSLLKSLKCVKHVSPVPAPSCSAFSTDAHSAGFMLTNSYPHLQTILSHCPQTEMKLSSARRQSNAKHSLVKYLNVTYPLGSRWVSSIFRSR